jgi:hypothetical protein
MIQRLLRMLRQSPAGGLGFAPAAGQLLSVETDEGGYGVMKLLAVDGSGVHATLFVQRFASRPRASDLGELSLAGFGPGHDNPLSIGHMPISYPTFATWRPVLVDERPVSEDEMEGYRMWQEAEGGYF